MFVVKMNDDKSLAVTKQSTNYKLENKAEKMLFLIPQVYGDITLSECVIQLYIINPRGVGKSYTLTLENDLYANSYLQSYFVIDTDITSASGNYESWLNITNTKTSTVVKTGSVVLSVKDKASITDYFSSEGLETLDQLLVDVATINSSLDGKVDKVTGKGLSTEDYTAIEKNKLANQSGTNTGDETEASIKSKLGINILSGSNTGDQDLSGKVDKVDGMGLSDENYTTNEKNKLSGIENSANNYVHPLTHSADIIIDGTTNKSYTAIEKTKLSGIADGAQVNAVTSVASKTGAVTLVKGDVGLGNVTNDAQVKKSASSVDGNIPVWSGVSGDALGAGYGVETTLAGGNDKIPRADAVKNYIDGLLAASDAMVFKGTLGTGGTIAVLPTTHSAGWSYKVITAGTYAGAVCEVGDLIIATIDRAGSGNLNADWVVIQTNIDGAVTGPASATDGNFPLFDGITGKLIKNSAYGPSSFSAASHNHDATYTKKYTTTLGGATSQVVTHNLNTRDVSVTIRETGFPYAIVLTDVELTTVNTLTVFFAVAPTSNQYTVTIIG